MVSAQLKKMMARSKLLRLFRADRPGRGGDLKVEDEIIKIGQGTDEPVDVTGYSVTDAVKLIRGAKRVLRLN